MYFVTCANIRKAKIIIPNIHSSGGPYCTLVVHGNKHTSGALSKSAPLVTQSTRYRWPLGVTAVVLGILLLGVNRPGEAGLTP